MFLRPYILLTLLFAFSNCESSEEDFILMESHDFFYDKCLLNANEEAHTELQQAEKDLTPCLNDGLDFDAMKADMIKAKSSADYDSAAVLHCGKALQSKRCVFTFANKLEKCLSETERNNLHTMRKLTSNLVGSICNNRGSLFSEFGTKGGMKVLNTHESKLWRCYHDNIMNISIEELRLGGLVYKFDNAGCDKISDLQKCVMNIVETSSDPKITKIINQLFKSALGVTPCSTVTDESEPTAVQDSD